MSVKDTVTAVAGQISSEVGLDGAAVPQPAPPPALEKFTVVTRNCEEPGETAGSVNTRVSFAGAGEVNVTFTEAAPTRSGSVTVMVKGMAVCPDKTAAAA